MTSALAGIAFFFAEADASKRRKKIPHVQLVCGINNVGLSLSVSVDALHGASGGLVVGGDRLPRHIQIVVGGGCHRAGQVSLPGQTKHAPVGNPCALFGQTCGGTQHTVGSVRIESVNS